VKHEGIFLSSKKEDVIVKQEEKWLKQIKNDSIKHVLACKAAAYLFPI
jgi:hypothetical protein